MDSKKKQASRLPKSCITQGMLTLQFLLFTHSKDFSKNFQTEQQCKFAGLNWNYGMLLTELVRGLSFGFRPVLSVLFWVFLYL